MKMMKSQEERDFEKRNISLSLEVNDDGG